MGCWLDVSALCSDFNMRLSELDSICDMACSYDKCKGKGGGFWTWPKLSLSGSSFANSDTALESLLVGYACNARTINWRIAKGANAARI